MLSADVAPDTQVSPAQRDTRNAMRALGVSFNRANGNRSTIAEARQIMAEIGPNSGIDAKRWAQLMGFSEATINNWVNEDEARHRARRLGFHLNGDLKPSQMRLLGSIVLNDRPWRAFVTLVQDTGMSVDEARAVYKEMRACHDDDQACLVVDHQRASREEQISEYRLRGKAKPPYAAMMRQRLGFILGFREDPARAKEHNPSEVGDYVAMCEQGADVLLAIVEAHTGRRPRL